ncbi:MAG: glycosyltransferase, partial [Actinomycetota bacterium]
DGRTIAAVVVGEGADLARARNRAVTLGVSDRVRFTGWVEPDAVPTWLAAADVVVAPSRTSPAGWVEAQGLAIVEAMAAARPVVATRTGGVADVVVDGDSGVLVDEGDPDAIARAVLELHDDPGRSARMGRAGRERAVSVFAADRTAAAMGDVLAGAAEAGRRRRTAR